MAQADKFKGHCFAFASSWTKVAHADKFRGYFFGFASSWTKVAQADKLKGRQCILLLLSSADYHICCNRNCHIGSILLSFQE